MTVAAAHSPGCRKGPGSSATRRRILVSGSQVTKRRPSTLSSKLESSSQPTISVMGTASRASGTSGCTRRRHERRPSKPQSPAHPAHPAWCSHVSPLRWERLGSHHNDRPPIGYVKEKPAQPTGGGKTASSYAVLHPPVAISFLSSTGRRNGYCRRPVRLSVLDDNQGAPCRPS